MSRASPLLLPPGITHARRRSSFTGLFTPDKPLAPAPSHIQSIKNVVFYSPLNVLVLAIPVSWA